MLKLHEVTIFSIDCFTLEQTLAAIEFSTRWIKFAEIIVLTDLKRYTKTPRRVGFNVPIRMIHHTQGTQKVSLNPARKPFLPVDYEAAAMREPSQHVKTSHYLRIEADSAVLNPYAWDNYWLDYDYIGAPWTPHDEPGYPPCDGETNAVGNAGFSLQSVKYARAIREAYDNAGGVSHSLPDGGDPRRHNSDVWPCRVMRPWLEQERGIMFAPVDVAWKFSCENRIYAGQFGFHGKHTAEINNWGGRLFGKIRPQYTRMVNL